MLRIDLGALHQGPIDLAHEVPPDDPDLRDLDFGLSEPIRLSGRLMEAGADQYFWRGSLRASVRACCRRCLVPVDVDVSQDIAVLFTAEEGADDPAAYVIPPNSPELDLAEAVREELILAVPEFPLCREECRGLCSSCGTDLNNGSCSCEPEKDPRWEKLEALKSRLPEA